MQDIDQLPLQQWAEQLKQARIDANLDVSSLAQTLMLSSAQLRGLENGTLSAFHGPGYYLRAIEKYARHLDITLDPPVTELTLTDSQIALNRVKNQPSAAKLAKREALTLGAEAMPRGGGSSRVGMWLGGLLIVLIAAGTWLAITEGWPGNDSRQTSVEPETQSVVLESATTAQTYPSAAESATPSVTINATALPSPSPAIADSVASQATTTVSAATVSEVTTSTEPASEPVSQPAAAPEPVAEPTPDIIEAQFNADCWVEVRFTDGRTEQGIYKPGQTLSVPVADIERLTFGNAQAVNATRAGDGFDVMTFTRARNNVARISGDELRQR